MQKKEAELTRFERIEKEEKRLKSVFRGIDKNKLKVVEPLIQNAAFTRIALEDLQEEIAMYGYTVEYQNGENQRGTKQSDAVKTHIAMTKNLANIIKQLEELTPAGTAKSRLSALRDE